jgi:hypothetical protein
MSCWRAKASARVKVRWTRISVGDSGWKCSCAQVWVALFTRILVCNLRLHVTCRNSSRSSSHSGHPLEDVLQPDFGHRRFPSPAPHHHLPYALVIHNDGGFIVQRRLVFCDMSMMEDVRMRKKMSSVRRSGTSTRRLVGIFHPRRVSVNAPGGWEVLGLVCFIQGSTGKTMGCALSKVRPFGKSAGKAVIRQRDDR